MTRKPRVAIYGGDERNERLDWPKHLDIQVYPYKSPRSADRLRESLSSGSVDHLVLLTGYMGHGHGDAVKSAIDRAVTNVINWNQSPGQLSRKLAELIPPMEERVNPLLTPTRIDDPMTGGGRGPLKPRVEAQAESKALVPMFEHVVPVPPRQDETLGRALTRILSAEGMSQVELSRLLKVSPGALNYWIKDRGLPRDMGPLVDLWPELARFDKERTHKVAPTAALAEERTTEDLRSWVRGIKAEPKAQPAQIPTDEPRLLSAELVGALARWRKAKEELETTERYLLILLRESGL